MIDAAKKCGADCVKFQSWSKDTIFSEKTYQDNFFLKDDYRNRTDYTLKEIVDKYSIDRADHYLLKEYCDSIKIDFNSTPFSVNELNLLVDELNVPFIKVASMDLNNAPFLSEIAKKKKPVVISTGLGSMTDVCEAIPNGAIYILDYQLLKKQRTYYSENTIPYIMSSEESVDIDTQFDFKIAEFMMKELENESL